MLYALLFRLGALLDAADGKPHGHDAAALLVGGVFNGQCATVAGDDFVEVGAVGIGDENLAESVA